MISSWFPLWLQELQDNAPLLYLWYAESEVANSSGSGLETESSSRAMHILSYLGSGLAYVPYTSQPSSMQILRARQGFREKLKKIQSIWSHGVTDDQSAAVVCSAALFEELTNDLSGAVEILDQMFSSVLPGYFHDLHSWILLLIFHAKCYRYTNNFSYRQGSCMHWICIYPNVKTLLGYCQFFRKKKSKSSTWNPVQLLRENASETSGRSDFAKTVEAHIRGIATVSSQSRALSSFDRHL